MEKEKLEIEIGKKFNFFAEEKDLEFTLDENASVEYKGRIIFNHYVLEKGRELVIEYRGDGHFKILKGFIKNYKIRKK